MTDTETLRAAAATCRLAARTFAAEVDPPFHRALIRLCHAPHLASRGLTPLDADIQALSGAEAITAMAVEYCRLFIGPRPVCPPYASARNTRTTLGSRARDSLHTFLHEHHLRPEPPAGSPIASDDHVAVALALLDRLYTTAAGDTPDGHIAADDARAAIGQLHDTYLAAWLPDFLHDVTVHARRGPYKPIAQMTSLLLHVGDLTHPHRQPQPEPDPASQGAAQ